MDDFMSDELTKPLDPLVVAEENTHVPTMSQTHALISIARDLRRLADYTTSPQRALSGWEDPDLILNSHSLFSIDEARASLGLGHLGESLGYREGDIV